MEQERDWFRREALELDKMNKDHKRLIIELKMRLEALSEDKDYLQQQLIQAKSLNRATMYELDQFKQKFGDLDGEPGQPWRALTASEQTSPPKLKGNTRNIFEPTAVPDSKASAFGERTPSDLAKIDATINASAIL